MFWEICGLICVLLVVVFILLYIVGSRQNISRHDRIQVEGVLLKSWLVVANNVLYDASRTDRYSYAVVLFSPDPAVNDNEDTMVDWLERVKNYRPPSQPEENERIIASVMKTQVPYFYPLRLPSEISGDEEGYMISLRVYRNLLPRGKLTLPYIFIKVLIEPKGEAIMVRYPASEHDA